MNLLIRVVAYQDLSFNLDLGYKLVIEEGTLTGGFSLVNKLLCQQAIHNQGFAINDSCIEAKSLYLYSGNFVKLKKKKVIGRYLMKLIFNRYGGEKFLVLISNKSYSWTRMFFRKYALMLLVNKKHNVGVLLSRQQKKSFFILGLKSLLNPVVVKNNASF